MDYEEKITEALLDRIEEAGSARKFAMQTGFSNTYISHVLHGKTKPSTRLLKELGFEKHINIVDVRDGE